VDLSFLLGLDLLSYFKFTFDFDAISKDTPYGSVFWNFARLEGGTFPKWAVRLHMS